MSHVSGILTSKSQSQRDCSSQKENGVAYFKRILRESGVQLSATEAANVLTQEQSLVIKDMEDSLKNCNVDQNCKLFLHGMEKFSQKEQYFSKALLPSQFKKESAGKFIINKQDSVMRILLNVMPIQNEAIDIILNGITHAIENSEDSSFICSLLAQLQYLPHIKNANKLTKMLLDIIEIAPIDYQMQILHSLPEIIPDTKFESVAKQLSKMLDENTELIGPVIMCLNELNLSREITVTVQDQVLAKLVTGGSALSGIFPILLQFVLRDNTRPTQMCMAVSKIRVALDDILVNNSKSEKIQEEIIVILKQLSDIMSISNQVCNTWITLINSIKHAQDHKPSDYLILFILDNVSNDMKLKRKATGANFKNRIVNGLFKCQHLDKLFDKYMNGHLIQMNYQTIMRIANNLLRTSNNNIVINFASYMYQLLFKNSAADANYSQEIILNLIELIHNDEYKNISSVLEILSQFLNTIHLIQPYSVLLMQLLDKLEHFELKDVKHIFEILSTLACAENCDRTGLKHDLQLIIQKQLSSTVKLNMNQGIVAAVVLAKHLSLTDKEQTDIIITEECISSIENFPSGRPKKAAIILELVFTRASQSLEFLSLFYDQLASMVVLEKLDKNMLSWLYEHITNDFQEIFLIDQSESSPFINDLTLTTQYNINKDDEIHAPIAVNIAGKTLQFNTNEKTNIITLASHFRLLTLIHNRCNKGNLSSINALLGCGVILPQTNIDDLESSQIKQVANCLFHCCNWFREVIGAFVKENKQEFHKKVITRLKHLLEIEDLLKLCMDNVPTHKLPLSYFDSNYTTVKRSTVKPSVTILRPPKRFKSSTLIENSQSSNVTTIKETGKRNRKIKVPEHEFQFRQMDGDIGILLIYPLRRLNSIENEDEMSISYDELRFIFAAMLDKLRLFVKNESQLSHLHDITPMTIKDYTNVIPGLNNHLQQIIADIKLLKQDDNTNAIYDQKYESLKNCFYLGLENLSTLFSWTGFQYSHNMEALKCILTLLRNSNEEQDMLSINKIAIDFVNRLDTYVEFCPQISHAVLLTEIMDKLSGILSNETIQTKMLFTCERLLCRRWYIDENIVDSGKKYSEGLYKLLKVYFTNYTIPKVKSIIETLLEEAKKLKTNYDYLETLQSVDKRTFPLLFRQLCVTFNKCVENSLNSLTNEEHLTIWCVIGYTMHDIISIVKETHETKTNLISILKAASDILKTFLHQGLPIMEIVLRSKTDKVMEILKIFQSNVVFVHSLCCHSKLTKDRAIMAHVPKVRLTLETLLHKVKATLVANNCTAAFCLGNLKNRDLQGDDIVSQTTSTDNSTVNRESSVNEEESDDDLFNDIEEDEDESDTSNDDIRHSSSSVYD